MYEGLGGGDCEGLLPPGRGHGSLWALAPASSPAVPGLGRREGLAGGLWEPQVLTASLHGEVMTPARGTGRG